MSAILSLILVSYCLLLLSGMLGRWRTAAFKPVTSGPAVGLSVVVALRNESENVQSLIDSLKVQEFESFEVILVNDHSTDDTLERLQASTAGLPNFRILSLPADRQGKKEALGMGISQAVFEVIITTDADCTHPALWLSSVAHYFNHSGKTLMLIGPVALKSGKSFFSRLQQTEFVSVMGVTAAAVGLGHPVMCNGANLAFRKEAFHRAGGYTDNLNVSSGDDEFLMRKIFKLDPKAIHYLNDQHGIVRTNTQPTLEAFFAQRWRWAGKWKKNTDWWARLLAVDVLMAHVAFLFIVTGLVWSPWLMTLALGKIIMELLFLKPIGYFLHRRFDWVSFLVLQFVYPLYVTMAGLGPFLTSTVWKGRINK